MQILYLHGYQSSLNSNKREVLERFGEVYGPTLDYDKPDTIIKTIEDYKTDFDCVVGSSAGGLLGFYYSRIINVPALLFNPALYLYVQNFGTEVPKGGNNLYQRFILGMKDEVVIAKDTIQFLGDQKLDQSRIEIIQRRELQHQIPVPLFKVECKSFFTMKIFS